MQLLLNAMFSNFFLNIFIDVEFMLKEIKVDMSNWAQCMYQKASVGLLLAWSLLV